MKRILTVLFIIIVTVSINAQTARFGKNKVTYKSKDWQMIETDHFDIYYYQGGEQPASFAVNIAEGSIRKLENEFAYKMKNRIPLIIYNSHKDFEETNVTIGLIEEFVGGFTESLKNRVVVPFEGSYEDFRHVINHEIVHALQFDMLYGRGGAGTIIGNVVYDIPLWFIEGSAEFYSREWDSQTDMYMRNAVIYDNLIDLDILQYYSGGYIIYKEGQSVLKFIADTYGRRKIVDLYRSIRKTKSFERSLKSTIGLNLKQLDQKFKFYLKKRYAPVIAEKQPGVANSKSLLGDFMDVSPYNVSPALSPDGNYAAFISERYGYFDIYLMSIDNTEYKKKIIPRTLTRHYESFHLKQGNLNWSSDSRILLFSVRERGSEVICLYNVPEGRMEKRIMIDGDGVFSPAMNSQEKIVFTVMRDGQTDIAVYDIESEEETILTDDIYDDINPRFLDSRTVVFASSRNQNSTWDYDEYNLFTIDINTGKINSLTDRELGSIENFSCMGDSVIVFETAAGNISNFYSYSIRDSSVSQLTDVMTGVFNPSVSASGDIIAGRYYGEKGMDIFMMTNPFKNAERIVSPVKADDYTRIFTRYDFNDIESVKPPLRFSFDWAAGAFSYSPGYGFLGLMDVAASDIMGNNRLYINMERLSTSGNGYITAQYWYMKQRFNIAMMYLNLQQEYMLDYYATRTYRYHGGGILFSWPLDRYNRIDIESDIYDYYVYNNYYYNPYFEPYVDELYRRLRTVNSISFVHDNIIWGYYGPVNGNAARFDIGIALNAPSFFQYSEHFDPDESYYRYTYIASDMRKYFVLTPRSQIAVRLAGNSSFGPEYNPSYIGGLGTVRGYPDYQYRGSHAYFSNIELRFPLIDRIQFPVPGIFFGNIRGVIFTDMGFAKDDLSRLRLFAEDFLLDDLKIGYGAGIRMDIWFAILKLDVAKHTDLRVNSPDYYWHIGFGAEF